MIVHDSEHLVFGGLQVVSSSHYDSDGWRIRPKISSLQKKKMIKKRPVSIWLMEGFVWNIETLLWDDMKHEESGQKMLSLSHRVIVLGWEKPHMYLWPLNLCKAKCNV